LIDIPLAFTEIEAIRILCGAAAEMVAGGGVGGAEGSVRLALWGSDEEMGRAERVMNEVAGETAFEVA